MTSYENALQANIVIAFFVPAIVYLADAIGTQSEAVAVRGLSLSATRIPRLVAGEIATGMLIGGVLAAVAFLAVWLSFSNVHVAATVALAIIAAGTVATSVGSFLPWAFLPWAFQRLGYDPAYGSGPVGTVIQDVLSLVIYFWIAGWLVFQTVGR
jgi:magnesium transporter